MRIVLIIITIVTLACSSQRKAVTTMASPYTKEITQTLRNHILEEAAWALIQEPITVTAQTSPRSAGSKHDFSREGDYWGHNPVSADTPYIIAVNPNK